MALAKNFCNLRPITDHQFIIGIAGKELLDTYSIERQPVGLQVVTECVYTFSLHLIISSTVPRPYEAQLMTL